MKAVAIRKICEIFFPDFDYRWGVTIHDPTPTHYMYGGDIAVAFHQAYHDRIRDWCVENGVTDYRVPQRRGDAVMFRDEGEAMLFYLAHA